MKGSLGVLSSTTACALALLVLIDPIAAAAQNAPGDYPQWRGRNRDGSASGFIPPAAWPDVLTRRWRVNVGEGYATPLVVEGTVYVFTRINGREGITALEARAGVPLWRSDYPAPFAPASPAAAHGAGPKATPLFHRGRLFTVGISGIVAAFDPADGRLLWRTPDSIEPPYFSAASSPLGVGDLVITHPGNYEPLTAFDVATGAVRWTAGDAGFFMSPALATFAGTEQVISVTQTSVIGVSIPDGRLLWKYAWSGGGAGGPMPIPFADTVIVSATGMGVRALRPIRRGETWDVQLVWETKDVSMYVSTPVIVEGTLFGLSQRNSGQFFALDAADGRTLWLGPPRQAANTAIVKAPDLLFLLNDDAELIVARTNRTAFEPLRRYSVADSPTWAQPAVSGNRIYVKDESTLTLWTID